MISKEKNDKMISTQISTNASYTHKTAPLKKNELAFSPTPLTEFNSPILDE
jgi:hypothetical protein